MIVLLTITVDSRGARATVVRYVPIWVRHPDFMVLPAGTAWRADPADAAALRASYDAQVAAAGRGPRIQPIPARLLYRRYRPELATHSPAWRGVASERWNCHARQ